MDDKYLSQFIIEAGKVKFETSDGHKWQMRQPTPDEAADGDSAWRLTYDRVLADKRLGELAPDAESLRHEARIRAAAAQAAYMIPLLLEDEAGQRAFNLFDPAAMAEFEALDAGVVVEMTRIYYGPVQEAIIQAKKKLAPASLTASPSAG